MGISIKGFKLWNAFWHVYFEQWEGGRDEGCEIVQVKDI